MRNPTQSARCIRPIVIGALFALIFLPEGILSQGLFSGHLQMAWCCSVAALLAGAAWFFPPCSRSFRPTRTDVLAAIYAAYTLFNAFLIRNEPVSGMFLLRFSAVLSVYLAARAMNRRESMLSLSVVFVYAWIEALLVLLQVYGFVHSRHAVFHATGTFFNPGLTGGFLAIGLCVGVWLIAVLKTPGKKIALAAATATVAAALVLTDSRAGWLAGLIGCMVLLAGSGSKYLFRINGWLRKMPVFKAIPLVVLVLFMYLLYGYKKGSADGRMFIWQNCLKMAAEKPVFGHGAGSFQSLYPHAQAEFFRQNPGSEYARVAGHPIRPFNEYLSVWIAQGLIGLLLLMGVVLSVFTGKTGKNQRIARTGLAVWLVFAFFSYPTVDPRLLLLPAFFTGSAPRQADYRRVSVRGLFPALVCLLGTGFLYGAKKWVDYGKLQSSFHRHTPLNAFTYRSIASDPILLRAYYSALPEGEDRLSVLEEICRLYPSVNALNELARNYKSSGSYEQARECFRLAADIQPSLITAKYELFLLALETGDTIALRRTGGEILDQPIKKEGTVSIKARAHVRQVLNRLDEGSAGELP